MRFVGDKVRPIYDVIPRTVHEYVYEYIPPPFSPCSRTRSFQKEILELVSLHDDG